MIEDYHGKLQYLHTWNMFHSCKLQLWKISVMSLIDWKNFLFNNFPVPNTYEYNSYCIILYTISEYETFLFHWIPLFLYFGSPLWVRCSPQPRGILLFPHAALPSSNPPPPQKYLTQPHHGRCRDDSCGDNPEASCNEDSRDDSFVTAVGITDWTVVGNVIKAVKTIV